MRMNGWHIFLLSAIALVFACNPSTYLFRSSVEANQFTYLKTKPDYLKVHMKNGDLYVLNGSSISIFSDTIFGYGSYYDTKRELITRKKISPAIIDSTGLPFRIPGVNVALIETNKLANNLGNYGSIALAGVPMAIYTIYCIANPKACFGSCPTFHIMQDGKWTMVAEGFSSSISPIFESRDIDMLWGAENKGNHFTIRLTNEALETHVIRYADLLIFPDNCSETVCATEEGKFFRASEIIAPESCTANNEDCLELVRYQDNKERFTETSPNDLAEKEEIILRFKTSGSITPGLLIRSRQTLLTTYLFYQVMALTGNYYGYFTAAIESGDKNKKRKIEGMWDKLGGIEIFTRNENEHWKKVDEIEEKGPIASDLHLVPLPPKQADITEVKLRMTKGLWRIDYLALANISGEELPVRIRPESVMSDGSPNPGALEKLTGNLHPLVTLPGDQYEINYRLPDDGPYHYFLDTKGYYLEWMREEWLAEQDLKKAAFAFHFPGIFLKKAAPGYKQVEPTMEKTFWESRYARQE